MANIRPISDRIVLKELEKEVTTKSGLILSQSADDAAPQYLVVAVGNGLYTEGKLKPMEVEVGDKVFIDKYAGNAVKLDGEDYLIVCEHEILGIIE